MVLDDIAETAGGGKLNDDLCAAGGINQWQSRLLVANTLAVITVLFEFIGSQTGRPWKPDDWLVLFVYSTYGVQLLFAKSGGEH